MSLQEENHNLRSAEKKIDELHNRSRKRSMDLLTEDGGDSLPRRKLRRSSSVPYPHSIINSAPCNRTDQQRGTNLSFNNEAPPKRRSLNTDDLNFMVTRKHLFEKRRNFLSGAICEHCKVAIRFAIEYSKCVACKLDYHEACSRKLEMPCLPCSNTPKKDVSNLKAAFRLADYCPNTSPLIPNLIVRCVMFLDKVNCDPRLYETFGNEELAVQLMNNFNTGRSIPVLNNYDTLTVAGCIMKFLGIIRYPLIPESSRKEFFTASSSNDQEAIIDLIYTLPMPHRDTLAYLCIHWKRLVESGLKDSLESVCRNLGPIVFGMNRSKNASDTEDSRLALQRLVNLPSDVILELLSSDGNATDASSTPLSRAGSGRKAKPYEVLTIKAV